MARAAPPAPSTSAVPGLRSPLRRVLIQGTEETRAIGIISTEFSRFYPQGIHSFEPFRGWKLHVAEPECRLLMW